MTEHTYEEIAKSCDEFVVKYRHEGNPRAIGMRELERGLSEWGKTLKQYIEWLIKNYEDDLEFVALAKWTDEGLIYAEKKNGKELMEEKNK